MSKLRKAMEKARETRDRIEGEPSSPPEPVSHSMRADDLPRVRAEEVNPSYSCTRHLPVKPAALKRHKVFAYFQGHPVADSLKILQTQTLGRLETMGGNTIMVTSANRGEGKTLTAVNLAVSMSRELNRTVLLVDANLRQSSLMQTLGLKPQDGLSNYLLKEGEIPDLLVCPDIQKLVILPSGRPLQHSAELLGSPRMESLVRELRNRYPERLVVFDTPSILSSADALAFSRFVDGILVVVEAEKTKRADLVRALELLRERPVLGAALNRVRT
jgi:non-specific protein-tyrosine kinase